MKVVMLYTASGPLVILTSYGSATAPGLLEKLTAKGIDKFMAWEIPEQTAKDRYGAHFFVVAHDLNEDEDLRVLDYNGDHAFRLFSFDELGPPILHEGRGLA